MATITILMGDEGSGKTLYAVILAYKYKKEGYKIISNMQSLKFKDYDLTQLNEIIEAHNILDKIEDNSITIGKKHNSNAITQQEYDKILELTSYKYVALIDEIYRYLDSRLAMSTENREGTYTLLQLRKWKIKLIGTTQDYFALDIRLRNVVSVVFKPAYIPAKKVMVVEIANKLLEVINVRVFSVNTGVYKLYNHRERIKGSHL